MKTEVIMKRELWGCPISQRSKSEFFSATDLVKAGNKWRIGNDQELFSLKNWLQNKSTKEFMFELESEYGKIKINSKGKNLHTWVHPLLFIDLALAISPKLKIEAYKWLYDSLLANRNDSGDSYKKMTGALFVNEKRKDLFPRRIKTLASKIKEICGNPKDWQTASQKQLELRNKVHENITLISNVLRDNDKAIAYGIREALK
ncbi:MAG: KilA-N domain-containing protein [Pseudoalteromonas sp.]